MALGTLGQNRDLRKFQATGSWILARCCECEDGSHAEPESDAGDAQEGFSNSSDDGLEAETKQGQVVSH